MVIKGIAEITNGDQVVTLQENKSTYIPQRKVHRLANSGVGLLEIIEIQLGGCSVENHIARFEDTYGRK